MLLILKDDCTIEGNWLFASVVSHTDTISIYIRGPLASKN